MAMQKLLKLKEKKSLKNECEKKRFFNMTKKEKNKFLSNDFIDRMIRVEQRVSASFGEHIPYKKTKYYLSLTRCEKKDFEKYYRNRTNISKAFTFIFFVCIAAIAVFNMKFTGNVVNKTIGNSTSSWISGIIIVIMIIALFFVGINFLSRRKEEKDFNKKFQVINKIISSRRRRPRH